MKIVDINFVGREKELAALNQLLEETRNNLGKVVFISAEPGYGKSELVRHFLTMNRNGFKIAEIQCNQINKGSAYLPFKDMLIKLNIEAFTKEEDKSTKNRIRGLIEQAGPDWISVIPVIGSFVAAGIKTGQAVKDQFFDHKDSKREWRREDIQQVIENELRRLAAIKPVIIFIDDLHWADPSSIDMINALCLSLRIKPFPLMLVGSFRSNEIHLCKELEIVLNNLRSYTRQESHVERKDQWLHEIKVPPFELPDINNYLQKKYPSNTFSPALSENLNKITKGNVLFVTSIVSFLERKNDIYVDDQKIAHIKITKLTEIPHNDIEAIIKARIDLLDKELRDILDQASAGGEKFSLQMIAGMTGKEKGEIAKKLNELVRKHELLLPLDPYQYPDKVLYIYGFTNSLVYKHVYESIDKNARFQYHDDAAEFLIKFFGQELDNFPEIKAEYQKHLQIARGIIDSVTFELSPSEEIQKIDIQSLLETARYEYDEAQKNYRICAMPESLMHTQKAKEILNDISDESPEVTDLRYDVILISGKALAWLGRYQEAETAAKEMVEIAQKHGKIHSISHAYSKLGDVLRSKGEYKKAIEWFTKALDVDKGNKFRTMRDWGDIGYTLIDLGHYDMAISYLNKALGIAEGHNIPARKDYYNNLGAALGKKGNYDEAIKWFQKGLELERNRLEHSPFYNNIGVMLREKGEYDEAIHWIEKALEIDESVNNRVCMAIRHRNLGLTLKAKGNPEEAIKWYKKAVEILEDINGRVELSSVYNYIAEAYEACKKNNTALSFYEKAKLLFEMTGNIEESLKMHEKIDRLK